MDSAKKLGGIDVLMLNHAVYTHGAYLDKTPEENFELIDWNLKINFASG